MGEVAKRSEVVDGEREECQTMPVDGCTARFRYGELALSCCMVDGMSQGYGGMLNVQCTRSSC